MIIRQLTADEKAQAEKAKAEANRRIKARRAERSAELARKYARKADREQRATRELPLLTGLPARVTDGEVSMLVDFDRLSRFCRSLRSPDWYVSACLSSERDRVQLLLRYTHQRDGRRGHLYLYGLPAPHVEALQDLALPTVHAFAQRRREPQEGSACAN